MTIGGLAKATGIPKTTIRFYEREGLLTPSSRSVGNYRLYSRAAAERLTFIGAAQAAGFELPAIRAVLFLETGQVSCSEASQIVTSRLALLRQRMLKLRQLERVLQKRSNASALASRRMPCVWHPRPSYCASGSVAEMALLSNMSSWHPHPDWRSP